MSEDILEIQHLVKDFAGTRALDDVSFGVRRNTVHCLVGENGAGKSTLIKILTGALPRTSGRVLLAGREYAPRSTREARRAGVSTLFQELNVVDQLTVAENLTLGVEDTTLGFLRRSDRIDAIIRVMNGLEPSISPRQRVSRLSVAQKQIVEIAKAVAAESDVIIMDEPTAAISEGEIHRLFAIVKGLRQRNVTVIYISHRLDEIFELGDTVTVLRDGRHVATRPVAEVKGRAELIRMMIGKAVFESYQARPEAPREVVLEVKGLTTSKLRDVGFQVRRGEIAGFYGLVGAGKTELARAIYGADPYRGEVLLRGRRLPARTDRVIDAGIALVPEERRSQGLFTILGIRGNVPVMNMANVSRHGFIDAARERQAGLDAIDRLRIATSSVEKETAKLSGGNQQKVVFAKCLFADADVLMLDEPTRGIDVGAKSEIYEIIRRLSREGKSILLFSSELPEIVNLCDTVHLLDGGRIARSLQNGPGLDSDAIMHVVTGGR